MKKRLLQTLTTVIVVSSLLVTPVFAIPPEDADTGIQSENGEEALEQKNDEVKELEEKKNEVEAQAASVNRELVDLLVEFDALQIDIENQGKRIKQAESDYKDAKEKEKQQYADMKLRIKYMYEEGNASFVTSLFTSQSFADLLSKAEYVQRIYDYDRNMLSDYIETKNEVSDLKAGLEADEAEMQALSEEMGIQKAHLESTLDTMRSQLSDFDSQLSLAKAAAEEELRRLEEEQMAEPVVEEEAAVAVPSTEDTTQAAESTDKKKEETKKEETKKEETKKEEPKKEETKKEETKKEEPKTETKPSEETSNSDKNSTGSSESKKEESSGNTTSGGSGNVALGQQIAAMGCQYIGNKYVYGGNSLTDGIDCSGFVYQIHKKFGITTPRNSSELRYGGKSVSYADKLPGDVICYSGHVAIYIGNNQIVHASNSAPYPQGGIKITSPANYRTVLAVRRYW